MKSDLDQVAKKINEEAGNTIVKIHQADSLTTEYINETEKVFF